MMSCRSGLERVGRWEEDQAKGGEGLIGRGGDSTMERGDIEISIQRLNWDRIEGRYNEPR